MSLASKINQAVVSLEAAQDGLEIATAHYKAIKALRGQDGYAITIGGIRVDVAVNGGREGGWGAKMIRGREMIHLGALKALDSEIDRQRELIRIISLDLARLAGQLATQARGVV